MEQTTIRKGTRHLPCKLSDDEVRLRGIDLAEANNEYGNVDDERKEVAKGYKESLDSINKRIHVLKDAVRNGVEVREVEVEFRVNNYMGSVTITRTDTGDIIEQRAMTPDEAQGKLDLREEGEPE